MGEKKKRNVPEDLAKELMDVANMLRHRLPLDAISAPGDTKPCGDWIADLLEALARGATASKALGIGRGRPKTSGRDAVLMSATIERARIGDGLSRGDAYDMVLKNRRATERTVTKAYERGQLNKLGDKQRKELRTLVNGNRKQPNKKK